MQPMLWLLAGLLALIVGHSCLQAYRFVRGTLADTLLLALVAAAAMAAGYLFL
jgi:hypothetical protein